MIYRDRYALYTGDALEILRRFAGEAFDAVLCDPPYGLSFMGKAWDHGVPSAEVWAEVLRVLKPGAFLLAFGGTRTFHRLTCAIEDAGFEIRDCAMWLYGSGFPKSMDISKALDKFKRRDFVQAAIRLGLEVPGNSLHDWTQAEHAPSDAWWSKFKDYLTPEQWGVLEREVVGQGNAGLGCGRNGAAHEGGFKKEYTLTAPATDAARTWEGYGTALKPAWEPCIVAMKPLDGTFAENALRHGVAGLNIEAGRIATSESPNGGAYAKEGGRTESSSLHGGTGMNQPGKTAGRDFTQPEGRWPANLILDAEAGAMLDAQTPDLKGATFSGGRGLGYGSGSAEPRAMPGRGDSGGASRFFYCAKASRREREAGLDGFEKAEREGESAWAGKCPVCDCRMMLNGKPTCGHGRVEWVQGLPRANNHPCLKPLDLNRYLASLILPPERDTPRRILVPFSGSGSEMIGALMAGWDEAVGLEMEPEYVAIAEARLEHYLNGGAK